MHAKKEGELLRRLKKRIAMLHVEGEDNLAQELTDALDHIIAQANKIDELTQVGCDLVYWREDTPEHQKARETFPIRFD